MSDIEAELVAALRATVKALTLPDLDYNTSETHARVDKAIESARAAMASVDEIRWRVAAAELDQLRCVGDTLQSEASRLAEWAEAAMKAHPTTLKMPYEVRMALLGVEVATDEWTQARIFPWLQRIEEQMDAEVGS